MPWGRAYFAVQAAAGTGWWVAVALSPLVRGWTLGELDPVWVAVFDIPLFVIASAIAAAGVRWAAWVATGWTILVTVGLALYSTLTTLAGWGVLAMGAAAGASVMALLLIQLGRIPTELIIAGPFKFRPAKPEANHLATTILQLVAFWGVFLVILPTIVRIFELRWAVGFTFPPFVAIVGLIALFLASALGIWSAVAMATHGQGTPLPSTTANRLVIAGPYRYVRNPMALAGIVQGAAIGLTLSSWLVVAYAVAGSILWNYAVRPLEERNLEERFGADFRRYRARVRCWVPTLPPLNFSDGQDRI
jgi:protein-S-isoprenylcysteine O-methyltransferase Ste14